MLSHRRFLLFLLVSGLVFCLSAPAAAGSRDLVVLRPGGPPANEQAQAQVAQLLAQITAALGWPADSAKAHYFNRTEEGLDFIRKNKPGFVFSTPGFYLKYREELQLQPINQVMLPEGAEVYYYIVVQKGTIKHLDDLRGRTLAGAHLAEPEFIEKVVLNNRLKFGVDLKIQQKSAFTALRELSKGQLDAVMIDTLEQRSLASLSFADQLEIIYHSTPIPNTGMMAIDGNAEAADIAALNKACTDLCGTAAGAAVCETFGIKTFIPIKTDLYRGMIEQWKK